MEKYGVLSKDGELKLLESSIIDIYRKDVTSTDQLSLPKDYKPVVYAAIPGEFDQLTQAVYQDAPVDTGLTIEIGVTVVDVPPDEENKSLHDTR